MTTETKTMCQGCFCSPCECELMTQEERENEQREQEKSERRYRQKKDDARDIDAELKKAKRNHATAKERGLRETAELWGVADMLTE